MKAVKPTGIYISINFIIDVNWEN